MQIGIVRRNGLGDLLCTFPLILYLQEIYPEAKITLFVDKKNFPLIPYLPPVDRVVVFPEQGNKYWNLFKTAVRYRSSKFDLAICTKTSPMKLMNLFLFWLGAKKRVAVVDKSWHSRLINVPNTFDETYAKKTHQALKALHLIAPKFAELPKRFYPSLKIPRGKKSPLKVEKPALLLSASTTRSSNRFSSKRYASIANRLFENYCFSVLIIAEPKDRARAQEIGNELDAPYHIYFPRNFEEFMVLLDTGNLYFVGDGGIAHIGAGFGKRGVVLYGETSPLEWRPMNDGFSVLYDPRHVDNLHDDEIYKALIAHIEGELRWKRQSMKLSGSAYV